MSRYFSRLAMRTGLSAKIPAVHMHADQSSLDSTREAPVLEQTVERFITTPTVHTQAASGMQAPEVQSVLQEPVKAAEKFTGAVETKTVTVAAPDKISMAPITKRYLPDNPSQSVEDNDVQDSVADRQIRKITAPEPWVFSDFRAVDSNHAVFSSLHLKKNYEVSTKQLDRIFSVDPASNKSSVTKSSISAQRPPEAPQTQFKMQMRTQESKESINAPNNSATQYNPPSLPHAPHAKEITRSDLSVASASSVAAAVNRMKPGRVDDIYSANPGTTGSNSVTVKIGKISLDVLPAQKPAAASGVTRKSSSVANRNRSKTVSLSRYYIKGF